MNYSDLSLPALRVEHAELNRMIEDAKGYKDELGVSQLSARRDRIAEVIIKEKGGLLPL